MGIKKRPQLGCEDQRGERRFLGTSKDEGSLDLLSLGVVSTGRHCFSFLQSSVST